MWYPTADPETIFAYSRDITSALAKDGTPLGTCSPFPLVVFAHGLAGCGTQSIFFTETLARHGYVVVAPDYRDAALWVLRFFVGDNWRPCGSPVAACLCA